jgi:phage terminase small subunit
VEEYLVDLSAANAARRAGYSSITAKESGWQLLQRPAVKAAVNAALAERRAQYPALHAKIVKQLSNLVFFDVRALVRADGSPKDISDLTPQEAAAISGIDIEDIYEGEGKNRRWIGKVRKFRFAKKISAAELLAKLTGGLSQHGPSVAVQVNVQIPSDPHAASSAYQRIINGD